jgi:Mg2+ and Co2+ transporter CorA
MQANSQNLPTKRGDSALHSSFRAVARLLSEGLLGFLALLAMVLALAPLVFALSPVADQALELLQWTIVVLFAVDYVTHLALASDKRRYVVNPWRLLDLFTIVVPLLSLLPQAEAARSSPVLRLLRLVRVVSFGTRAGGIAVREKARHQAIQAQGPLEVSVLLPDKLPHPQGASWDEFLHWVADPKDGWYHVSNVPGDKFEELAQANGVPRTLLESCLSEANYPRLEVTSAGVVLSAWLPSARVSDRVEVDRVAVLLISNEKGVFTVSQRPCDLHRMISGALRAGGIPPAPFPTSVTYGFLKVVLEGNEEVSGHFERQLRALEEVHVKDTRESFFQLTFQMRKELSAARSDMWRTKAVLTTLAESRVRMPGCDSGHQEFLRVLADQADYLYETLNNLREGLLSVLELHLNIVSFDMNKVMRLLAVVSVLGLIPGAIGGMFGMNLDGNPWPFTLPQVTFIVSALILLCLYAFFTKGWLR